MIDEKELKKVQITVITPTFNRAHTLERVYNSLKNQSFKAFKWLVMDDGSTDDTESLIKSFRREAWFPIEYVKQSNQHKFYTVFDGVKKVNSPYLVIWDSDDVYPVNSLEILFREVIRLPINEKFIAVMGLSAFKDGRVVGDPYPDKFRDGSILEMRYKHNVKGDKNGIFITEVYKEVLKTLDLRHYKRGVYIPYSVFFNRYDALGYKTRFVNKVIRYYMFDETDEHSVSSTRSKGANRYGLMVGYLSFINEYGKQLNPYAKAKIRNLVGYEVFALAERKTFVEIMAALRNFRFLGFLMFPLSCLYFLFVLKWQR